MSVIALETYGPRTTNRNWLEQQFRI